MSCSAEDTCQYTHHYSEWQVDSSGCKQHTQCNLPLCYYFCVFAKHILDLTSQHSVSHLSISIPGQYHLQIEKTQLEDDASYECQAGQSERSRAIISSTAWVNVLSEWKHGVCQQGCWGLRNMYFFVCVCVFAKWFFNSIHTLLTSNQHKKSS